MEIEFDETKDAANLAKHGVSFGHVPRCDWSHALIARDDRRDYGEPRYGALVPMDGDLHVVVFTPRKTTMRVISFRRATHKEETGYETGIHPFASRFRQPRMD